MRFCQSYVADLLSNAQFMFTEKNKFPKYSHFRGEEKT